MVESLDVEDFGDCFQVCHPADVTRDYFQNCCSQPQWGYSKKAHDGVMAMTGEKLDVMLIAEHYFCPPKLKPQKGWHD